MSNSDKASSADHDRDDTKLEELLCLLRSSEAYGRADAWPDCLDQGPVLEPMS